MKLKKIMACCLAATVSLMPASGVFAAEIPTEQQAGEAEDDQSDISQSGEAEETPSAAEEQGATVSDAKEDVATEADADIDVSELTAEEINDLQDEAGVMGGSETEIIGEASGDSGQVLLRTAASDGSYTTTTYGGKTFYHRDSDIAGTRIVKVIDVSRHNGTINFNSVKSAGVEGVILRCAYQGYLNGSLNKDSQFETYYKNAKAAGLKVGVYIYTEALSVSEAHTQANYVKSLIKGKTMDLPVVFDYENYSYSTDRIVKNGLSRSNGAKIALAFCDDMKAAGYEAMVYVCPAFEKAHCNGYTVAQYYPIWLARYNSWAYKASKDASKGYYNGKITMWQSSSESGMSVKVSGVSGYVDFDWYYDPIIVSLKAYSGSINEGSSFKVVPSSKTQHFGAYSEGYTYSSSNTGVATVASDGTVKGIKAGTAKITAKGKNSGKTAVYTVTVKAVSTPAASTGSNPATTSSTSTTTKPATANFTSLSAPGSLKASSATATSITLTWGTVSNSPTYVVCRSEAPNGSFKQIGTTTGKTFTDKSVTTNKEYYYKVYSTKVNSLNKKISSNWSNMATCSAKATQTSTISQMKTKVNLNMRNNPGTNYGIVTTIPSGKIVNVIANTKDSKGNAWLKVTYNGKTGYVYSSTSYLVKYTAPTTTTKTTKVRLNMRTGAGSGYRVILTIPVGKKVTVLGKSGSWLKVTYNGKTGYVYNSSSYLK